MPFLGFGQPKQATQQQATYLPEDTELGDLNRKFLNGTTTQLMQGGHAVVPALANRTTFRVKAPEGCPGVQYRRSKRLDDRHPRYAKDGDTVCGLVEDKEEWLRIGETCFLPISVNGLRVLEPLPKEGASNGSNDKGGFIRSVSKTGTVQAERLPKGGADPSDREAKATPPMEFTAKVPDDFKPGQGISVEGPHGKITLQLSDDARPGQELRYRLAPASEYQVEVPPGAGPGSKATFKRSDGVEICVAVPPGLKPGDTFEVAPPCLMVLVPEGVEPGQRLVFEPPNAAESGELLRAEVPEGIKSGDYFAACIPLPGIVGKSKGSADAEGPEGDSPPRGASPRGAATLAADAPAAAEAAASEEAAASDKMNGAGNVTPEASVEDSDAIE